MKDISKPIEIVCDPVFLLDREEWIKTLDLTQRKKDYILIYNLSGDNEKLINHARLLSKANGLEIHNLVINKKLSKAINIKGAGPKEFLEEILNATYVFSDSFHATVFSLRFGQDFFTNMFKNEQASQRMKHILEYLDLLDLYNPDHVKQEAVYNKNFISNKLQSYIINSKNWL